jgi:hypothetical protein
MFGQYSHTVRPPLESFGFQRLLIFATKPQEVAIADSCGCLGQVQSSAMIAAIAFFNTAATCNQF